jgi:hypothetical protein
LHGVEVSRQATDSSWNPVASELLIRRICVRYEDGRKVCFVPEAEHHAAQAPRPEDYPQDRAYYEEDGGCQPQNPHTS